MPLDNAYYPYAHIGLFYCVWIALLVGIVAMVLAVGVIHRMVREQDVTKHLVLRTKVTWTIIVSMALMVIAYVMHMFSFYSDNGLSTQWLIYGQRRFFFGVLNVLFVILCVIIMIFMKQTADVVSKKKFQKYLWIFLGLAVVSAIAFCVVAFESPIESLPAN